MKTETKCRKIIGNFHSKNYEHNIAITSALYTPGKSEHLEIILMVGTNCKACTSEQVSSYTHTPTYNSNAHYNDYKLNNAIVYQYSTTT